MRSSPRLALLAPVLVWAETTAGQTSPSVPLGPEAIAAGEVPQAARPRPVLAVPAVPGPSGSYPGSPTYDPALPAGTPDAQLRRDPAEPVTNMAEALQRAYWTNPSLLAERARSRSVDHRLSQARAQYGPQLQYSASYGYEDTDYERSVGGPLGRSGWTTTATAILTQPLFTFGRLRANEDEARAQIAFQQAALRAAEQQTLSDVIEAYTAVLRDRSAVVIAAENTALLSREHDDTQARLNQRESTATDLQQVGTRLELARAQLLAAEGAAASSDAVFLRQVGAPAGELDPPHPLTTPVQTLEDAYVHGDRHNPIVASAYAREKVSRAQLRAAKADLYPRIDLRGQADHGTSSPLGPDLKQTQLRGSITISGILDSGIRRARIAEASEANAADWRLIDAALRENRAELADAWNAWQAQSAAAERLRNAVAAAQQALEGGLLQERAGLRTTTEILELARDLLQVRSTLNTTSAAAYVARARLLAAMGVLEQDYLVPGTETYMAEAHLARAQDNGDIPLLTPLIRTLDSTTASPIRNRPVRDPTAPVAVDGMKVQN